MIPNHVLVLGAPRTGKVRVAEYIVSRSDRPDEKIDRPLDTHSGIIVKTDLNTKYYTTKLNLLIDEFPDERSVSVLEADALSALRNWYSEFISDEYEEIREVLEGLIFCIDPKTLHAHIEESLKVVEQIRDSIEDGFVCILATSERDEEELEDLVISFGFEFVNFSQLGKNEFHESIGKDRVLEILQSHEWTNRVLVHDYEQNKRDKADEMTRGLLDDREDNHNDMDLDEIFGKLRLAKDNVQNVAPEKREEYVNKIIEEVMDFL
ncbi:uncharacterized protein CANTADRAFT_91584 [Suhomyces tanzawaensis NRRL Y-17324]|uniref:Increased recombination centers protein 6 n=1 Tax=Suhomyces tanzawaensis NRRL Y-17324 TaxID=984487 RepID=A0A1E4SF65_9ASCO|nr:uncharacterized protein CANTADRAFT_91584 [Suhomyces tanzawaensis NRRL Y-17324]ODV78157.1 hypothetical protein CANTADRAFT_91584 [Suhomyces tanzawaensis NRRL Y-17324]